MCYPGTDSRANMTNDNPDYVFNQDGYSEKIYFKEMILVCTYAGRVVPKSYHLEIKDNKLCFVIGIGSYPLRSEIQHLFNNWIVDNLILEEEVTPDRFDCLSERFA